MSAESTTSPAAKKAGPPRKRKQQGGRAGVSLMAQGESMIWLTGGALCLCLLMIGGLLSFIAWCGAGTFWPVPIVRLETLSGKVYQGEVTQDQLFSLNTEMVEQKMTGVTQQAARELLGENTGAITRRRLLRIGNYELTNEHFQWVSDFELTKAGESFPEWALLLERRAWGRFVGEPRELVVRHVRAVPSEEQALLEELQFLEMRLSLQGVDLSDAPPAPLVQLREDLRQLQIRHCREFVSQLKPEFSGTLRAVLADKTVPLAELPADAVFAEAHEFWNEPAAVWEQLQPQLHSAEERFRRNERLEKHEIGHVNRQIESKRLAVKQKELDLGVPLEETVKRFCLLQDQLEIAEQDLHKQERLADALAARLNNTPLAATITAERAKLREEFTAQMAPVREEFDRLKADLRVVPDNAEQVLFDYREQHRQMNADTARIRDEINLISAENARYELVMHVAWDDKTLLDDSTRTRRLPLGEIVRAYPANRLSWWNKLGVYVSRWREFLFDDPREANSEGGVFPAIWGTVAMTLVMSLAVVPFGVLAALYLREYAKGGFIVSAVRIAINNLAGVPSIVFGVFGMGFFCYGMGAFIDGGPKNAGWPVLSYGAWWTTAVVFGVSFVTALVCGVLGRRRDRGDISPTRAALRGVALVGWIAVAVLFFTLLATTPHFNGLYRPQLPNPTFGKGALLWASLTLALLTLPVVIVATEEALSAVPNSLREGSYACGASKWQTIRRIVLPHAMPGIMTGMILSMARGAGEVAPLMLVGALKLAPELPVDGAFPFVHWERSFMHLGFHIYDLGFQSPNSEAAKPMVFTTTLLLIGIVFGMNVIAVWLRNRLRQRYKSGQF